MLSDSLPSLYAYNRWADATMFQTLKTLTPEQYAAEPAPGWASARSTVIHLGMAMRAWAGRLGADAPAVSGPPPEDEYPTVADGERLVLAGQEAFEALLAGFPPERLTENLSYRNLKGEPFQAPCWAVFRHVVNHATYHRGQVASKLKRLGVEPPATDLIYWAIAQAAAGTTK